MYDDFDDIYADELDALDEHDGPPSMSPKPKRSLNFTTPKTKSGADPYTPGSFTPLKSPLEPLTGSLQGSQRKRQRDSPSGQGHHSDSDLEYDEDDLNTPAPSSKRSKVVDDLEDDEDLGNDDIEKTKKPTSILGGPRQKPASPVKETIDEPPSPDRDLMERILQHRNRHGVREIQAETRSERHQRMVNEYDFERQRVFTRIPACPYLPTTGSSGSRVYMKMRGDQDLVKDFEQYSSSLKGTQLLTIPISSLRDQLEEERRAQLLEESERLSEQVHRELNQVDHGFVDDDEDDYEADKENLAPPPSDAQDGSQKLLWVEKYSPRGYTDLLSDESINRSLLHWLKLWDYVVFGKELPIKKKDKKEEPKKYKKKNEPAVSDELDPHKRPLQKLSLLCGPPGLGKTTLAHIIARHAGYNVIEMNASDDRSAEIFKNKIEAATQMKAVLGPDPRPNCLVIDEIDGAPQPAINMLLSLVRKDGKGEEGKKKKKEEGGGILLRPIICICNDQYVPALRLLRQNSMILNFPQTESSKLASRLYEVVRLERLKSDMNTLLALCEKTDNDIRSCLNTLQFIQRQCKEFNLKTVQTMTVGQKDSHKSLFSVWYEILTLPRPKRQRYANVEDNAKSQSLNTAPIARFSNIQSLVQGTGEYDKLTQGLFENYLECRFKDPHMDGVKLATEWLVFNDLVTQYIQHKQDYRLMPYLPFMSVTFHFLFASNVPPKVQYPHSHAENYLKKTKCENLVTSMMSDMSPGTRKYLNIPVVVMEILPPLMDIIQPTFRPVNTQLYSSREKADLAQLVCIMIAYNMTYHQEKTIEGQYSYVLDPHMEEVARFPGMKTHKQLTYASKQLIAREVELEKMRRTESKVHPVQQSDSKASTSKPTEKPAVPNHLQKLSAKPLGQVEETQVKDFFGRIIKKTTPEAKKTSTGSEDKQKQEKTNLLATDIWFHFQVGYSNAVRRNVRVKDFF